MSIIKLISNQTLETVTIKGDKTKRGAKGNPPASGIYVRRDGSVTGSASGSSVNVVLEGGSAAWEGAVVDDGILPYYTTAQMMVIRTLKSYIETSTNAYVEDKSLGE